MRVGGGDAAPPVWRTPEGTAAVPAGDGRAWPGFEIDHSERSSRRGRRAGGTPPTGTHSGPAQQNRPRGGQRSVGATNDTKPPGPTGDRAAHASGR